MFREIVKIEKEHYTLHLPKELINREVEILVLPLPLSDEDKREKFKHISNRTAGILSKRNIDPLKWQDEIREEWNDR